ncbi:DUF3347 domain-containing protein [Paenimyroides ceti]
MKSIVKMFIIVSIFLSSVTNYGQIKNEITESVKIYGKCDICKNKIEQAGNKKKTASVRWDQKSQMAVISYDKTKTNREKILKRIALAGYDNEAFLAPDDIYNKLPECCHYERELKPLTMETKRHESMTINAHHGNEKNNKKSEDAIIQKILNSYFDIKDALVKTDATGAGKKAADLNTIVKAVDRSKLNTTELNVWSKISNNVTTYSENMAKTKDINKQRELFALLSIEIYQLAKAAKSGFPIYYQHCPMYNSGKGADWLSKESTIKNPYYGSKMMNCGSTTETLN